MDTLHAGSPPPLALFRGEANLNPPSTEQQSKAELPVSAEMLALFESITGWVVEFEAAWPDQRRSGSAARHSVAHPSIPVSDRSHSARSLKGQFVIVDMSAAWPAGKPTGHRGKCDQFIKLFSDFVTDSQLIKDELQRLRNFVIDQTNPSRPDEDLADGFLPRYPYLTRTELEGDFEVRTPEPVEAEFSSEGPEPKSRTQSKVSTGTVGYAASSGRPQWQIGGRRGLVDNRYIDWALRKDHRIELMVGQIESLDSPGDQPLQQEWESKLTLNPETHRFWLSVNTQGTFWMLDGSTGQLKPIDSGAGVQELQPNQALILTTAVVQRFDIQPVTQESIDNADDLAAAIQDGLETDEPVLVLWHR